MFNKLKNKLKGALGIFSKNVEEDIEITETTEEKIVEESIEQPVETQSTTEVKPVQNIKTTEKIESTEPIQEKTPSEELKNQEPEIPETVSQVETSKEETSNIEKPSSKIEESLPTKETPQAQSESQKPIAKTPEQKPETQKSAQQIPQKPKLKEKSKQSEKKSLFSKVSQVFTSKLSESKFDEIFFEIEIALLENNMALEVIEKIRDDLKQELVNKQHKGKVQDVIQQRMMQSFEEVLLAPQQTLVEEIKQAQKPFVIAVIGINGSGKTTSIAKLIKKLQDNNLSVVAAAADTYRAAAIQQLEDHTTKLQTKLIKHQYGSDPAAVAFDAVKHAQAHNIDVVLIDSAGRLHHNENLMRELDKLIRVVQPHKKIFVGESITGNDCVLQAQLFNEKVGIDGIILSKADIDESGGAAISISHVTQKPIYYLGVGQEYDDLQEFDPQTILNALQD